MQQHDGEHAVETPEGDVAASGEAVPGGDVRAPDPDVPADAAVAVVDYAEFGAGAAEVRALTQAIDNLVRRSVRTDIELGLKLERVKALVGHGHWARWLGARTDLTPDTAERLMAIARAFPEIPHNLEIGRTALALLSMPRVQPAVREQALALAAAGTRITGQRAKQLVADAVPIRRPSRPPIDLARGEYTVASVAGLPREAASLPPAAEVWLTECQMALRADAGRAALERLHGWGIDDDTIQALGLGLSLGGHGPSMPVGGQTVVGRGLIVPVRTPTGLLTSLHLHDGRRGSMPSLVAGQPEPLAIRSGCCHLFATPDLVTGLRIWQTAAGTVDVMVVDVADPSDLRIELYPFALYPAGCDGGWDWVALGKRFAPPGWAGGRAEPASAPMWRSADVRRYAELLLLLVGPGESSSALTGAAGSGTPSNEPAG